MRYPDAQDIYNSCSAAYCLLRQSMRRPFSPAMEEIHRVAQYIW